MGETWAEIVQGNVANGKVRQRGVLDYIIQYKVEHDGVSPSVREIAEAVGLSPKSVATVKSHLEQLEKDGFIKILRTHGHKATGIMVNGGRWVRPY